MLDILNGFHVLVGQLPLIWWELLIILFVFGAVIVVIDPSQGE